MAAVVAWLRQESAAQGAGSASPETAEMKRRKLQIDVELGELELAERRRELVPIARAAEIAAREYAACRARLLVIPTKVAPTMAMLTDSNAVRELLVAEINAALGELSNQEQIGEQLSGRA